MKVSQILGKTRLRQANGKFYEKQADGKCSFCAMGVLALKSGVITRNELIKDKKNVHLLIPKILKKCGVKIYNPFETVKCPICDGSYHKEYLIAHLNNRNRFDHGHGLNFKEMAKVLAEMGW